MLGAIDNRQAKVMLVDELTAVVEGGERETFHSLQVVLFR